MDVPTNWWESFFEGVAVTMWLQALPAEHTQREADRLACLLAASPGAEILDVPCGAGRLALALVERGYRLTGVDWSSEFLGDARSRAPPRCRSCPGTPTLSIVCPESLSSPSFLRLRAWRAGRMVMSILLIPTP